MSILVSKPTCLYHPVKIIFLDDNQAFLNALSLEFGDNQNMIMLTNPDEAMLLIHQSVNDLSQRNIEFNAMNSFDEGHITGVKTNDLINSIYDTARFSKVAVIVIDYEMPEINGIQFCEQLKDINIFKILLTAEADKDTAINAFNNGTIDKFILKTSSNLHQEITISINQLTERYFYELSKVALNGSYSSFVSLFNQEAYKVIFNEILIKSDAIEYYLINSLGSFLFLTKDGKQTWLIISDQRSANDHADLLMGYGFSETIIQKIKQKDLILFLYSDSEYKESALDWEKYIFKATKLNDCYSYSVVNGPLTHSIKWEAVSFKVCK